MVLSIFECTGKGVLGWKCLFVLSLLYVSFKESRLSEPVLVGWVNRPWGGLGEVSSNAGFCSPLQCFGGKVFIPPSPSSLIQFRFII